MSSPSVGPGRNELDGVDAVSPRDVWAVGFWFDAARGAGRTLIEHWDGARWTVVESPNAGEGTSVLAAVDAVSATDAWAVGSASGLDGLSRPLIERWDGSTWSIVPTPDVGQGFASDAGLSGVAAATAGEAWAVGGVSSLAGPRRTLTLRWDGSRWSVAPSPGLGGLPNALTAVSAVAGNDAWAVGTASTPDGGSRSLLEHWNGSTWSVAPMTSPGLGAQAFGDVAALDGGGAWAVGFAGASPVTERWDGTAWAASPATMSSGAADLSGAAAVRPNDVWAVGGRIDGGTHAVRTLVGHWDGTAWSVVASGVSGDRGDHLQDVAALPTGGWAVGSRIPQVGQPRTLIIHRCTG